MTTANKSNMDAKVPEEMKKDLIANDKSMGKTRIQEVTQLRKMLSNRQKIEKELQNYVLLSGKFCTISDEEIMEVLQKVREEAAKVSMHIASLIK